MRETSFIQQNKEKWHAFEQALSQEDKQPEALDDLFVQVTDDLSYSRTFYPNRSVRVYLNGLAQRVFAQLYRTRRSSSRRLLTFWSDELPQLVYESRAAFRFSFFVFVLAMLIGAVSCAMAPDFLRVILGDAYVDMTLANIESGDPMAVYKQKGAFGMSLGITINNMWVAFLTFVLGAFFTVGTIAILIRNGVMLGAFQYFFIQQGLFRESFLTVWIHGTLEISAIVIAGAAGITMGRGLAFPGTYRRSQSFQRSARRGVKLMVGIAPIIFLAGFIEGYLTRHTQAPDALRLLFILACLAFVLLYFVWYPRVKAAVGFAYPVRDSRLVPQREQRLTFDGIRSSGELFTDVFAFYKRHLGAITMVGAVSALVYVALAFLPVGEVAESRFFHPNGAWAAIGELGQFFRNPSAPLVLLANALGFALTAAVVLSRLSREERRPRPLWLSFAWQLLPMSALAGLLYTSDWYTSLLLIVAMLVPVLWGYIVLRERANPFSALGRAFSLWLPNFSRTFSLSLTTLLIGLLFYGLANSLLAWFFLETLTWVVPLEGEASAALSTVLLTFVNVWVLHLVLALALIAGGLLYYTLLEIAEAPNLRKRIQQVGRQSRIRGLEKE